jgi:hypothetical protein
MPRITSVETLQKYLHTAMQLEHATIPPYLLALYSIHPGTNPDSTQIIRVIAVEEMLHLTLGANLLNAVGGTPDLTAPNFVPFYPAYLPDGEDDFRVHLRPFSKDAISTFLQIERSDQLASEDLAGDTKMVRRHGNLFATLAKDPENSDMRYYSIGDFYMEILRGLNYLHERMGSALFPEEGRARQVSSEYFYSGGGKLFEVTDIESARKAINLIIEQGEGYGVKDSILTQEGELSHDFRFEQIQKNQYYDVKKPDMPGNPTGPKFEVDWNAVYPAKIDARLSDYQNFPDLLNAAIAFNLSYADFLVFLTRAFNGEPQLLLEAVPKMFLIRNQINQLFHNPIPGLEGTNAAPTFEMPLTAGKATA